jgi:uncharacterized Zn finger protein
MSDTPQCPECGNVYCECDIAPRASHPALLSKEAESFIQFQASALVRGLSCAEVDQFTTEIATGDALYEVTVTRLD